MTLKQIEKFTSGERSEFMNIKCHIFDESMSLDDYTEAVRDYIYIWRRIDEGRKAYTFDWVTDRVKTEAACIKRYYEEHAPVDDAAVDVDYCCG